MCRTVKEPWGVFLPPSCVLVSVWQYPHGCWQLKKRSRINLSQKHITVPREKTRQPKGSDDFKTVGAA